MEKLNEGMSLSDLQTILTKEYNQRMTYFELRMLAAQLKVDWEKRDRPKPKPKADPIPPQPTPPPQEEPPLPEEESEPEEPIEEEPAPGQALVTFHDTPLPGTALSGDVTFPSGIKSKWFMDRMDHLRKGFAI